MEAKVLSMLMSEGLPVYQDKQGQRGVRRGASGTTDNRFCRKLEMKRWKEMSLGQAGFQHSHEV